jgi:GH35 family endo-1,4-beta-xylanase
VAKFKISTLMCVEMEIPFHEFTYFAYISIREMEMKWNTLDPETEFWNF